MENRHLVDQRRQRIALFVKDRQAQLAEQGTVVATYRRRGARRAGPYFLLVCRDELRQQHSIYLGPQSRLVDEVQMQLQEMQLAHQAKRVLKRARREIRNQLAVARRDLDRELARIGLRRQGAEIRGWRTSEHHNSAF